MWAYVTTSKSMEPLYHHVVHPVTNPQTLNGHSTRTSKAVQTSQIWVNIFIFDKLIFPPFIFEKLKFTILLFTKVSRAVAQCAHQHPRHLGKVQMGPCLCHRTICSQPLAHPFLDYW